MNMLEQLKEYLVKIINDIDSGNSYINEEQGTEIIDFVKNVLNKSLNPNEDFSKYSAAKYLKISRATFDNYVSLGKLPKGSKKQGFKELRWYKKDLDKFKEFSIV